LEKSKTGLVTRSKKNEPYLQKRCHFDPKHNGDNVLRFKEETHCYTMDGIVKNGRMKQRSHITNYHILQKQRQPRRKRKRSNNEAQVKTRKVQSV